MLRLLFIQIVGLVFTTCICGQTYFQKTYDLGFTDAGNGAMVLGNGDILTGGEHLDEQKIWIQRLNPQGAVKWSRLYKTTGNAHQAVDIQQMTDGSILVVYRALVQGTGTVSGWMKITEAGDFVWNRQSTTGAVLYKALPLANGGYLLTGADNSAPNNSNALAIKINEDGQVLWHTSFGDAIRTENLRKCWENSEGFIYCAGVSDKFNGDRAGLLTKLAPNGTVLWSRRYGIPSTIEEFNAVAPFSGSTDLLLAGHSLSPGFEYDRVLLIRVSSAGDLKWARTYEYPDLDIAGIDLLAIPGDQFLVSFANLNNGLGSPSALMKVAQNGDIAWKYEYKTGGERNIFRKLLPSGGGFIAAGSSVINGDEQVYVARIGQDGLMPGSECCPTGITLIVRDAVVDNETFTPAYQDNFSSIATTANQETANPVVTEICQPIDLDFALSDSSICPGECIDITLIGNSPDVSYTLTTTGGIPDPDVPGRVCYPNPGTFFVVRKGAGSSCTKEQTIKIISGVAPDAVPNAFTPNGDGVNDRFKPVFFCPVLTSRFSIFNRWGKKVFESQNPDDAWDGKVDGKEAPSDVYVWLLEYEAVREGIGQKLTQKGSVALLR
ncbi:MAG: gliding motility-associated C-terminal domain-containing protein [Lewinellaceae bacterium]|nr:gliding motility-associated C-terminal domain-containing protein [Lewinellaceae bacterium]